MNGNIGTGLILDQILNVLSHLDGKTYQRSLPLFSGASLGQHFRHIYEFYECIIKGFPSKKLDYANRNRDPLIEQNVTIAMEAFQNLRAPIAKLDELQIIAIFSEYSNSREEKRKLVQSSVGRELMYAYDHAIHHLAIIKMGLQVECPDLEMPENFGVAPSTVKHRAIAE